MSFFKNTNKNTTTFDDISDNESSDSLSENESDKRFLEEQMLRARMVGTQVKQQLTNATNEYNDLYKQA